MKQIILVLILTIFMMSCTEKIEKGAEENILLPNGGQMQVKIARAFIGKLDPAVQEKFAYKNAELLTNED